jgi:hypothetical protein
LLKFGRVAFVVSGDRDDGESHLECPRVHDGLDGHVLGQRGVGVRLRRQLAPKIVLLSGLVLAEICEGSVEFFKSTLKIGQTNNDA